MAASFSSAGLARLLIIWQDDATRSPIKLDIEYYDQFYGSRLRAVLAKYVCVKVMRIKLQQRRALHKEDASILYSVVSCNSQPKHGKNERIYADESGNLVKEELIEEESVVTIQDKMHNFLSAHEWRTEILASIKSDIFVHYSNSLWSTHHEEGPKRYECS